MFENGRLILCEPRLYVYFQLPKGVVNINACQYNSDECALSVFGKEEKIRRVENSELEIFLRIVYKKAVLSQR